MNRLALTVIGAALIVASLCLSARASAADDTIDFNRDVRPILANKCFSCHGPDAARRKGKLRLDQREAAVRRGALVPGKPDKSEAVRRIFADEDEVMPPAPSGKKLSGAEKLLLKRWVAEGAVYSPHWAFVAPIRPPLPAAVNKAWGHNPIDAFILARLEKEGLAPTPEAERPALIRRVTLDLTGLPPTIAEVDSFLQDKSPDAYEKVVDRLLRSPRYGEHMAHYWLDAARYGDTHGLHIDNYREMWPYRDWVINAFNTNQPFDRFLTEQLAGDLLPGATREQQIATGFLRCHVTTNECGVIEEEAYVRNVQDRVDTCGTVLLGLTLGCAKCHDHKYDPLSLKDYYSLFAFFNNLDGSALDGDSAQPPPFIRLTTPEQAVKFEEVQGRLADLRDKLKKAALEAKYDPAADAHLSEEGVAAYQVRPDHPYDTLSSWVADQKALDGNDLPKDVRAIVRLPRDKRTEAQRQELLLYFLEYSYSGNKESLVPLREKLKAAFQEKKALDRQIPTTLVFKERRDIRPAFQLRRGEYDRKGAAVERATPDFLPAMPEGSPKNRLGLARWVTDAKNPLTARVTVNRLWQQLFGVGLVQTVEDFGVQGEPPSHPELLDWLAVQFVEDGWDVKKTMRRMVVSATYRQSAKATNDRLAKDPHNRLLSRGALFRLDAEVVRDQALFAGGLLVERIGGPPVKPPQPPGLWEAVGFPGGDTSVFKADAGPGKVHRRSLYTFWKRTAPPPQLAALDAPSRESCVVRRERTDTPLQALLLLNDQVFIEAARGLAERTLRDAPPDADARLRYLVRLVIARAPDDAEMAILRGALHDHLTKFRADPKAAAQFVRVGEKAPDPAFTCEELAAWTLMGNLVLNLDEALNR